MDRRDFIQAGAIGATGLTLEGETTDASPATPLPLPDMEEYLACVDAGMDRIAQWSPSSQFPEHGGDPATIDSLAQKSVRALFMTGMFADLPIEGQVHSGMQGRVWAAMPEMDEAVDEMTSFLESQTPDGLHRVRETLRNSPEVIRQISGTLNREAELCGVSEWRRRQMQAIIRQAAWRIEHQPPSLIIDEYLTKIEKVSASDVESEARQNWLAARIGEQVFWKDQESGGENPGGGLPQETSVRTGRLHRGARLMGIAILIGGAGGIAIAIGADATIALGAGLLTAGAIVFLVGLIILLVGLTTSSDDR